MSVAGIGSYQALPYGGLATGPMSLANPLAMPAGAVGIEDLGARPSFTSRIANAARAALAALKGGGVTSDEELQRAILAMQGSSARIAQPAALLRQGRPVGAQGQTRALASHRQEATPSKPVRAKTWKTLAVHSTPTPTSAHARPTIVRPQTQPQPQTMPGSFAMPGGMVTPIGGNPAGLAGLQGLPPQVQAQLGMTPTMQGGWQGQLDPTTGAPVPDAGPQLNATNQSGLGQGGAGATQAVTNRNTFDALSSNRDQSPWGSQWGGMSGGFDAGWGAATPYAPYGSSMNGYSALGGENRGGFLSRLFGR